MGGACVGFLGCSGGHLTKWADALQQQRENKAQIRQIVSHYKFMIPGLGSEPLTFNGEEKGGNDNVLAYYLPKKVADDAHASVMQAHFNVQYELIKKIVNGLESGGVTIAPDQSEAVLTKLLEISGKNLDGLSGNIRQPRPQHCTKTLFAAGRVFLTVITLGLIDAADFFNVSVPHNPLPDRLAGHEADVQNAQEPLDVSQAKLDEILARNQELYSFGSNPEAEALRQGIQDQLNSPVKIGGQEYPSLIEYVKTQYGEGSDYAKTVNKNGRIDIVGSLEKLNANIDPKVLSNDDLRDALNSLRAFNVNHETDWSKTLTADVDKLMPYVKIPLANQEQVGLVLTQVGGPSGNATPSYSGEGIKFLEEARNTQANVNADAANLHAAQESLANFKNTVHDAAVGTTATVVALEAASAVNAITAAGKAANTPGTAANSAAAGVGGEGAGAAAPTAQSKVKRNWLGKTLDFKAKWVGALGIVGYLRQLPNICTALRSRLTSAHEYHGRLLLLCKQMNVKEVDSKSFVTNADKKTGIGGLFIRRIAGQFAKQWVNLPTVQISAEPSSSTSPVPSETGNNFKEFLIKTGHYYTAKTKQDAIAAGLTPLQKVSMGMKAMHAGVKFGLLKATNTIGLLPALSTAAHWATTTDTWFNMKRNGHFTSTKAAFNVRADELKAKASTLSM